MEIRIECSCGTPYAFEVEPVGGRMPTTVQCPSCGVDGGIVAMLVWYLIIKVTNTEIVQGSPGVSQ